MAKRMNKVALLGLNLVALQWNLMAVLTHRMILTWMQFFLQGTPIYLVCYIFTRYNAYIYYRAEDCLEEYVDYFYLVSADCLHSEYYSEYLHGACSADGSLRLYECSDSACSGAESTCSYDTIGDTDGSSCYNYAGYSSKLECSFDYASSQGLSGSSDVRSSIQTFIMFLCVCLVAQF